jgi:hypothetical protein
MKEIHGKHTNQHRKKQQKKPHKYRVHVIYISRTKEKIKNETCNRTELRNVSANNGNMRS